VKVNVGSISELKYPDDFSDFQDYLGAYYYVAYVARAVGIKQFTIWQMGQHLESEDESGKTKVANVLIQIQAGTVVRDGSLSALVFGNMYWQRGKVLC
jgi:hypothetical protein